jgi:methylamine---glutamate N-methyltransferase subunit B
MDAVGERRISYDARGLAEPNADVPKVSTIDGSQATFDAHDLTTRQINLELRWLLHEQGVTDVTVQNPGSKHSIGVGILTRCKIRFEGSLGYFGCGLIDGPEIHITGRVGWSACENMMSGVVVVDGNAGSMNGFMMQRGRQIICGDVGQGLGDSMYDGIIYVGGKVKSLGIDCVPGEWTDADTEFIERKFRIYELGTPPEFQKFVCGKKLYNYDNLEPSERKLVL